MILGTSVGLAADLLSPLRTKAAALTDLLWSLWISWIWLVICFDVCRGDIRMGYCAAAALGAAVWRVTVSPANRKICSRFLGCIFGFFVIPLKMCKIFLKIIKNFRKKLFPTGKKWVTIGKGKMPQ